MGSRTSVGRTDPGLKLFGVVRLDRAWEPEEIARFQSELNLRGQLIVYPVLSLLNPTEIIFRSSEKEVALVERLKDEITPAAARVLVEPVFAQTIDCAMSIGMREPA